MPKKLEHRIEREYERKGYSKKRSEQIAYATMNKLGLLHPHKGKPRKGGRKRGH